MTTTRSTSPAPTRRPDLASADPRRIARTTGAAILLMAPFGMFGNVVTLGLGTELAAMADRVVDSALPVALAVIAFGIVVVLDTIAAWGITQFFADRPLARLAGWMRLAYAAVLAAAAAQLATALNLARAGADDAAVASGVAAFSSTWQLGLFVFGGHLILLGALLIRTPTTPTIIGWIVTLAGASYVFDSAARLLLPADSPALAVAVVLVSATSIVGELGLAVWMLIRGGRDR
jgi:hypothetical protein